MSLAAALLVLVARFVMIARASLSYDEATYVEIAAHPWTSSFYPETFFVRHPPLYFLLLGAWTALVGTSEAIVRFPSLLATTCGVVLTWDAVRRTAGDQAAALAGLLLGTSFLVLVYALQSTMYPFAFALAALGVWAHVRGKVPIERLAVALLPLVHLFGFGIALVWLWRRRATRRRDAWLLLPGAVWLVGALVAVVATRAPAGPSLGPAWQALRVFAIFYEGFSDPRAIVVHALVVLIALLLLNPALLYPAWNARRSWSPWAFAGAALVVAVLPGPGFLRYALLPLPFVLVAGSPRLSGPSPHRKRLAAAAVAFSLVGLGSAAAFVGGSIDPRAGNDVPGALDWRAVADRVVSANLTPLFSPAPTAVAYYLAKDHGMWIVDSSKGPGWLVLDGPRGRVDVREVPQHGALADVAAGGAYVAVPDAWSPTRAGLAAAGFVTCWVLGGVHVMREAATGCPEG